MALFCRRKKKEKGKGSQKRQRSKIQKSTSPISIGPPTGFVKNPWPNPGDAEFPVSTEVAGTVVDLGSAIRATQLLGPKLESRVAQVNAESAPSASRGVSMVDMLSEGRSPHEIIATVDRREVCLFAHSPVSELPLKTVSGATEVPRPPNREPPPPPAAHGPSREVTSEPIFCPSISELDGATLKPESAIFNDVVGGHPQSRYMHQRHIPLVHLSHSESDSSISDLTPQRPPLHELASTGPRDRKSDTIHLSIIDPAGTELYERYLDTGKIQHCIRDAPLGNKDEYAWQRCSGLISAYIHGTDVGDIEFADRIIDIISEKIPPGACVDFETIKHIFERPRVPEQLKQFVVDRSIDAGKVHFRREHTRSLPRRYLSLALETALERLSSGDQTWLSASSSCHYHQHRKPERCYKRKEDERGGHVDIDHSEVLELARRFLRDSTLMDQPDADVLSPRSSYGRQDKAGEGKITSMANTITKKEVTQPKHIILTNSITSTSGAAREFPLSGGVRVGEYDNSNRISPDLHTTIWSDVTGTQESIAMTPGSESTSMEDGNVSRCINSALGNGRGYHHVEVGSTDLCTYNVPGAYPESQVGG